MLRRIRPSTGESKSGARRFSDLSETKMLSDLLPGRSNNLNLIRMVAASMVLVSHAHTIVTGDAANEPLVAQTGEALGKYAVIVFFGISGLLITRSFDRNPDPLRYLAARVLRLWPGLAMTALFCMFVIGGMTSTLPATQYFAATGTYAYFVDVVTLVKANSTLPGVFAENPMAHAVNGSLWSLFCEFACYILVLMLGLLGLLRRKWVIVAVGAAFLLAFLFFSDWTELGGAWYYLGRFSNTALAFIYGMIAYTYRESIPVSFKGVVAGWLAVLAISFIVPDTALIYKAAVQLALVYSVFYLAYVPGGFLLKYNDLGDYSYGMYIFAFPVQQTLLHYFPAQGIWENVVFALMITLLLAVLSWHFVEQNALKATNGIVERLEGMMPRAKRVAAVELDG